MKNNSEVPFYIATDEIPLPPVNADILTTACDYCVVACGYKVYRWPQGESGGPNADENALGVDYPTHVMSGRWISSNQHNIVSYNGKPHHVAIIADAETKAVNLNGDHSIRGGTIAKKCYNPNNKTKDRLLYPMVRVNGQLQRIGWDDALDIVAQISRYVIDKHGDESWGMKMFSYQYFENTYALTKLALQKIRTPAFAVHDQPTGHGPDTPGLSDAGIDPFSASYEDWSKADVLFISGSDPFESKTIIFNEWIKPGIERGMKLISVVPRRTTGVAYGEKMGGLYLDIIPGTDTILHLALARIIIERGWQDNEFIESYINNKTESDLEVFQANGFADYSKWILSIPYSKLDRASEITGISTEKIQLAAKMIAEPRSDGSRPKTSFGLEKGNYWSNNYLNTASFASLGLICGAGNRPGQIISRFGGHQRGMMPGGDYPAHKSFERFPNYRKKGIDLDRYVESGKARFVWVVGTTWIQAMTASKELKNTLVRLTNESAHQVTKLDKQHIIEKLKHRVDNNDMVVVHQDIYPVVPIGTDIADIVLPASGWGENDFSRANGERRLRLYSKFYDAPGETKADWWIAAQVAKRMGYSGFDWNNSNEVFEEAAWHGRNRRTSYLPLVWYAGEQGKTGHQLLREYGTTGIQAPIRYEEGQLVGTKRLHDSTLTLGTPHSLTANTQQWLTEFKTPTGRANLLKTPWELFEDFYDFIKPQKDELWVTSGRINEVWQSGFDDILRRPYLQQRWPENFIEINPADAKRLGIESGDYVVVSSDRIPVQTGGYEPEDAARQGVVFDDGLVKEEEPDLILAEMDQKDSSLTGWNDEHSLGSDVEEDLLLNETSNKPEKEPVNAEAATGAYDLEEGEGLDASAIGLSWNAVKAMTFTELQKNGHIKLTSAQFKAVAMVTPAIREGVSFTYFLLPGSAANSLAPRVLDPISQRYRYKLGIGKIKNTGPSPYKDSFAQMSFIRRDIV